MQDALIYAIPVEIGYVNFNFYKRVIGLYISKTFACEDCMHVYLHAVSERLPILILLL